MTAAAAAAAPTAGAAAAAAALYLTHKRFKVTHSVDRPKGSNGLRLDEATLACVEAFLLDRCMCSQRSF